MSTRYFTNAGLAISGAFLVVASQAFSAGTFAWLSFSIGVLALVLSSAIALKGRGTAQRGLDLMTAALAAWTIVESLVFSGSTVTWLGFGAGAAFAGLALIGLTLHELSTERVVHSIEVRQSERDLSGIA